MTSVLEAGPRPGAFFRRFVRDWRSVGAVCPSSRQLAEAMVAGLHLGPADVVVEYGAGTGSFTEVLRERLTAVGSDAYLGIERDEAFHRILVDRWPDLRFAHGSVEDVEAHLRTTGLGRPTVIVSGLPLILMPRTVVEHIVGTTARILRPGGTFRTFSYVHSYPAASTRHLRRTLRTAFDRFTISDRVWWNCPPALVLRGDQHPGACDPSAS